ESRHGFSVEKLLAEDVAFFVARFDNLPAGCAGIKLVDQAYGEIKRMYVRPHVRGSGLAVALLDHLAAYARAHGISRLRLETGIHQHAAIRLYERMGFYRIPPFGPYTNDPVSLCYEKRLTSQG
ncbi:MAG TPA: GNAT family N-acetyltransferase, partial [Roseiflexaceae bacterium]|nr:GNAT family N-acetyltransferase [Roseiflexaceae bacterium]